VWEPLLIYRLQLGTKQSTCHTAKLGQTTQPNTGSVLPSLCGGDISYNLGAVPIRWGVFACAIGAATMGGGGGSAGGGAAGRPGAGG